MIFPGSVHFFTGHFYHRLSRRVAHRDSNRGSALRVLSPPFLPLSPLSPSFLSACPFSLFLTFSFVSFLTFSFLIPLIFLSHFALSRFYFLLRFFRAFANRTYLPKSLDLDDAYCAVCHVEESVKQFAIQTPTRSVKLSKHPTRYQKTQPPS